MALRSEFSLGHSEFNDFLFASVGEEKSGIQLTVLSALTRLGFDPWGEAARLSDLSNESAGLALAAAIARLPEGDWKASDARAIATRLIGRLPKRTPAAAPAASPFAERMREKTVKPGIGMWWAAVLVALLLLGSFYRSADHTAAPAPGAPAVTERSK
jgi:hypothetical protein